MNEPASLLKLQEAIEVGDSETVFKLYRSGEVRRLITLPNGLCPSEFASRKGKHEIAEWMISCEACADIDVEFIEKIQESDLDGVRKVLKSGRIFNAQILWPKGEGPLELAARLGSFAIAELLLDSGFSPNRGMEESPVIAAIEENHLAIIRLLIQRGANVNGWNISGMTPLMIAVLRGNIEVVKELVEAGADVNLRAKHDDETTAAHIAASEKYEEIYSYLSKLTSPEIMTETKVFYPF